ncbi:MAG: hypothetical protein Ta2B_21600 [Termitinemataceae bacterium]|nr:MAG: hypothetical protein Ta2B_21600 [Termitinemataceae bacterium]
MICKGAMQKRFYHLQIKIPAAERGIFVLPESCTSGLIPPVTPQRLARETSSVQKVLNPTARITFKLLCFVTAVLFVLSACSRAAPTLAYSFMQLVYMEGEDDTYIPHITFFVLADDEDGVEDIAELRLYNDFEGLVWKATADNWTQLTENEKTWIGSRDFVMPAGEPIPNGQFRAVLIDKGGDQGTRTFGFDGAAQSRYPFPKVAAADGTYSIVSAYPQNSFLCYSGTGEYKSTVTITKKTGNISELSLGNDIVSIALWAADSSNSVSVVTKQHPVK